MNIELEIWTDYANEFRKHTLCTDSIIENMFNKGWSFTSIYGGIYHVLYPIELKQIRYDGKLYNTKGNQAQCDMLMRNLQTVIALNELE